MEIEMSNSHTVAYEEDSGSPRVFVGHFKEGRDQSVCRSFYDFRILQ